MTEETNILAHNCLETVKSNNFRWKLKINRNSTGLRVIVCNGSWVSVWSWEFRHRCVYRYCTHAVTLNSVLLLAILLEVAIAV